MTVDAATTNLVGRGLGLAFTDSDATYLYLKPLAERRVTDEAPADMDSVKRDHCIMLMICHMYACSDPAMGMRSFSGGGFSGSQDPGMTIYLQEFMTIVSGSQPSVDAESSVERSDAVMPELQLDAQEVPTFFSEE